MKNPDVTVKMLYYQVTKVSLNLSILLFPTLQAEATCDGRCRQSTEPWVAVMSNPHGNVRVGSNLNAGRARTQFHH